MSSEPGLPADALRMGRIGYLNVLPIYHPLEAGIIPHDFEIISGPPAVLNNMMARGELHISSNSCFEYAMRPERYHLVEDLSIGSHGNVMSVLLMSRRPVEQLGGQTILISGETHTSVALLRLLMKDHYHCDVNYVTGAVTPTLGTDRAPEAFLAIGDEALRLRNHPDYPYRLDLADAWVEWTGPSSSGSGWSATTPCRKNFSTATPARSCVRAVTGASPIWMSSSTSPATAAPCPARN